MIQNEHWGLVKALRIIEAEGERLEEENQAAIRDEAPKRAASISQQILAVNAIHDKIQAEVIRSCG